MKKGLSPMTLLALAVGTAAVAGGAYYLATSPRPDAFAPSAPTTGTGSGSQQFGVDWMKYYNIPTSLGQTAGAPNPLAPIPGRSSTDFGVGYTQPWPDSLIPTSGLPGLDLGGLS